MCLLSLWACPGHRPQVLSCTPASALLRLSAGAARTSRGPWTWRAPGTTTPSPMMSWMTSTRGRARAVSTSSPLPWAGAVPSASGVPPKALGSLGTGPPAGRLPWWGVGEQTGEAPVPPQRGWRQGLETSEPRTPRSPQSCLYTACVYPPPPTGPPCLCRGARTPLSNPVCSTALTSGRNLVATSRICRGRCQQKPSDWLSWGRAAPSCPVSGGPG